MEVFNTHFTKKISIFKNSFETFYNNYVLIFLINFTEFIEKYFLNNNFFERKKHKKKFIRSYTILNEKYRKVGSIIYLKSFNIILKKNENSLKNTYHLAKNPKPFLNVYRDIFKNFKSFLFQIFIQSKIYNNRFIRFLRPGF